MRDGTAPATEGEADGLTETEEVVEVEADDGSGGRERREAGEAAAADEVRLFMYCGEKAGGRVQRNGEGGGCGRDGDAADTGE